jgi:four helix bundle protein
VSRNYRNIKAWQKSDRLVKELYFATKTFPTEERFGIVSQLRRAAVSVAANIVEGSSRQHRKDYLNFLYNAKASLSEVEYLLSLSHDLEFLTQQQFLALDELAQEAAAVLAGLIKAVDAEVSPHTSVI